MSSQNGYGWKPRQTITLTCPSGQKVTVRRPGPEFALRAGRIARTFTADKPDDTETDVKVKKLEEMSDEDIAATGCFARELVCAMLLSPKLVLNPRPERDEIGPDDIGDDFWFLFNYGMQNFYNLKVPVGEGEVEVKDLSTFREEPGVSGDSVDGVHVPIAESERASSDRGLVDSARA